MPSSGHSMTSTCLMQSWASRAAGPPIEPIEHDTAITTGQDAPCRGRPTTRTSWAALCASAYRRLA
jgi:hypothetical protein